MALLQMVMALLQMMMALLQNDGDGAAADGGGAATDGGGGAADDDGTAADDDGVAADDDGAAAAADDGAAAADGDGAAADGGGAHDGGAAADGRTVVDGGVSSQSISACVPASGSWLSFFTSLSSIMTHVDLDCLTRTKTWCLNIDALAAMVCLNKMHLRIIESRKCCATNASRQRCTILAPEGARAKATKFVKLNIALLKDGRQTIPSQGQSDQRPK